jgi:hypothetical protein
MQIVPGLLCKSPLPDMAMTEPVSSVVNVPSPFPGPGVFHRIL